MEKKPYQKRRARRRANGKRRRTGLFVFLGLVILTLGAFIFFGTDLLTSRTDAESVEQVEDSAVEEVLEAVSEEASEEEQVSDEEQMPTEEATEEEEETPRVAPSDPTMYLSIPKLGISGAIVADGEAGLELGAMHLAGTGYPWLPGSNTFIAGHRVGFPGTGSDRIFYSLPSMAPGDEVILEDSLGQVYRYQVSEIFAVTPFDLWVTEPTGSDVVTLQVCTETPDDWWTIGPGLMDGGPESGRLMVRAVRV